MTPTLIAAFYVGCLPAAISDGVAAKARLSSWGVLLVLWAALWLVLVGLGSG